jgi:hypothetical protein
VVIGVVYGATSGYLGGRVDEIMMRIVDILYSLPVHLLVIMLVVFFGRNFVFMFIAVARSVARHGTHRPRPDPVDQTPGICPGGGGAGRSRGRSCAATWCRTRWAGGHLHDAARAPGHHPGKLLSYLGLGVQEPNSSWGVLISQGAKNNSVGELAAACSLALLTITLFALNFLGDASATRSTRATADMVAIPRTARQRRGRASRPVMLRACKCVPHADGGACVKASTSSHAGETVRGGESGRGKSQAMMAAMGVLAATARSRLRALSGTGVARPAVPGAQPDPRRQGHHDLPGADEPRSIRSTGSVARWPSR